MKNSPSRKFGFSKFSNRSSLASVLLLLACGTAKDAAKDTDSSLGLDRPSDSTGTMAKVAMAFDSSVSSAALHLQGATSSTLDLGGGVVVSDARLNIAAIKVKALKEESEGEKKIRTGMEVKFKERAEKESAEDAAVEAELESSVSLAPSGTGKEKLTKEEALAKKGAHKQEKAKERKTKDDEELAEHEKADKNMRVKGPFIYNAVTGKLSEDLPNFEALDGTYRRIEFQLKPNRNAVATDGLLHNTFFIKGTVKVADKDVPFQVSYHMAENIRLASSAGAKLEASGTNKFIIAFDLKGWFSGLDFSKATLDASGAIIVDKKNNKEILKAIHKNMKKAAKFGKDSDNDGKLKEKEVAGDASEQAASE